MLFHLISWHGTVIHFDNENQKLNQLPLAGRMESNNSIVEIEISGSRDEKYSKYASVYVSIGNSRILLHYTLLENLTSRTCGLSYLGKVLCAERNGEVDFLRDQVGPWETFLLVTAEELLDLRLVMSSLWVNKFNNMLKIQCQWGERFLLHFAEKSFPIEDNLSPFRMSNSKSGIVLYQQDWMFTEYESFRPLIYYSVFGNEAQFEMLSVSLISLAQQGYEFGDILIITEKPWEYIKGFIPSQLLDRVYLHFMPAADFFDFCAARYKVLDWNAIAHYQPLLYLDTDVVFDLPPRLLLEHIFEQSKMSAQRENFSSLIDADSVGSELLAEDEQDVGNAAGFNSGVISVPNVKDHYRTLMLIPEIMRRVAHAKGRYSLRCFDQAIANYVAFKCESFDLDILTPYVRYFVGDCFHGGNTPRGLVHFWGERSASAKTALMKRYLENSL